MDVLACVKRVPMVGGRITLTEDGQEVDTRLSGFTSARTRNARSKRPFSSPSGGRHGHRATLGRRAEAQLWKLRLGAGPGHPKLVNRPEEWGRSPPRPCDRRRGPRHRPYDPLLFGEAADTGGYQVPVRVAHELGLPCPRDQALEVSGNGVVAALPGPPGRLRRPGLPSSAEGINLPRYPRFPAVVAKRATVERLTGRPALTGCANQAHRAHQGSRGPRSSAPASGGACTGRPVGRAVGCCRDRVLPDRARADGGR
jgi:electron transfer flavoprotein beta subunit